MISSLSDTRKPKIFLMINIVQIKLEENNIEDTITKNEKILR